MNGVTDAILLESDGHFGMVDSGEDWDYPNSEQYPLREGITINEGYEQQVIHYLRTMGVKKLDFYIATHSHSDHIGSGDEIMNYFPVDRLYIDRYDDSYMLDSHGKDAQDPYYYLQANENYLWDNQYVYDCLIKAANDNNVKTITDLDLDENDNALVVKVNAYGKNALLTSDIDPKNGDTKEVADQLVEELWNDEGLKEKEAKKIEKKNYDFEYNMSSNYEEYNVFVPDERQVEENIEDESQPNLGKKIQIDLMKMVHHGVDYNNTTYFLTSLNPKTVVITGPQSFFNDRMKQCLSGTEVYSTMTDSAAIVAEFSKSGIDTKYNKIISGTEEIDGETYWFDEKGRSITGWKYFDNAWHYYNEKGILETGWQTINGSLYYMNSAGIMLTGWQYIDGSWYYMDDSGARVNNCWYWVGTNCYYFNENGEMAADAWIGDWYVDGSGAWIPEKVYDK